MSCDYLTPEVAHTTKQARIKRWKNCWKKVKKNEEKQLIYKLLTIQKL